MASECGWNDCAEMPTERLSGRLDDAAVLKVSQEVGQQRVEIRRALGAVEWRQGAVPPDCKEDGGQKMADQALKTWQHSDATEATVSSVLDSCKKLGGRPWRIACKIEF